MVRRLYRQERLDLILQNLRSSGYVSVAELSQLLGVSSVTVRADLDALAQAGQLVRTHGGAVPFPSKEASNAAPDEQPLSPEDDLGLTHLGKRPLERALGAGQLSFSVRERTRVQAKERIGAAAAELVGDGEAIILDGSTTVWHMARALLPRRDLTVLTTGLYTALELLRSPSISVMLPGGPVWREAVAIVGAYDRDIWKQGNFQRVFLGGRGFSLQEGLTDPNPDEVALKRQIVGLVREVNVLVDASKFGKISFAASAKIEEIHRVITDRDAPEDFVAALRDRGIEVILA